MDSYSARGHSGVRADQALSRYCGWAWTDTTWTDPRANANLISNNGIGGGQVGYNWQTGSWVLGAEAQASGTHIRKGWVDPDPLSGPREAAP